MSDRTGWAHADSPPGPARHWGLVRGVVLGLVSGLLIPAAATAADRPNVLLILTDDQGWFDLGVHGNPDIATPNLDRLAGEGARFTRFYAQPVCAPTRAALMTGRHPQRTGAIDTYMGRDTLAPGEVTLGDVLGCQGYRTALVGKWHLGRYARYHPNARGFDHFFGFWQYGFINRYMDPDELFHDRAPVAATGYVTDILTDAAITFLRSRGERPFFLYLAYNAPHDPHLVPDSYIERYLKKGLPLREARIYGMITSLDENIGRLLKTIDDQGLREKTIVLFLTDNGGVSRHFKAGLRAGKGTVYEGGIRVPLFVRWPGRVAAGTVIDALAQDIDLLPTLCEATGTPLPSANPIDGQSLLPLLRAGGGPSPHPYLYRQWTRVRPDPDRNWAVSNGHLKLVDGKLYDLDLDPGETRDLAPERPESVRILREAFTGWFEDVTSGRDYARVPIEVGRDDENPVEIDVTWGEPVGQTIQPTYRRYIRDAVTQWSEPTDSVRWRIDVVCPGRYEVVLTYGCPPDEAGSRFRVTVGEAFLDAQVEATPGRDVFRPRTLGVLDLPAGSSVLEVRPSTIVGRELMTLHKVWLRRLP